MNTIRSTHSVLGLLVVAALLLRSCSTQQELSTPEACNKPQSPVAQIVNSFNCRLTAKIGGRDNLFFSPFCLSVTLAMTYLGARGSTAREMEQALGYNALLLNDTTSGVHDIMTVALHSLENHTEEYSLLVANAVFVQAGFHVLPRYLTDLKSLYTANAHEADFALDGLSTVAKINEWVSNHTHGKIDKLIEQPLDPMTTMVLMNAIYFKGFWEKPFSDRQTRKQLFHKADGTVKHVPFMESERRLNYFEEDDVTGYKFLELDYKGDHISMILMLPIDRYTFPELDVTDQLLCRVRSYLVPRKVMVFIPKFRLTYERELSDDMKAMGVNELFDDRKANLTGMRAQNDIFASLLLHKAVIEVNEEGTEAAAVGLLTPTLRSGHAMFPIFRADHPFLFCIIDKRSGTILFMGRIVDP